MNINTTVTLVTGANRGIGKAFVEALHQAGAKRIYAIARNLESLQDVIAIALDVTNLDQITQVAPGPIETELFRAHNPPGSTGEQRYLQSVSMGRFGKPEEIATTISFFADDDAAFITGQTLFVDGGSSIGTQSW